MLETTEESVTSALKRARATAGRRPVRRPGSASTRLRRAPPPSGSSWRRLTRGVRGRRRRTALVALLTEDVWVTRCHPLPLEYQGRELAAQFFAVVAFRPGRRFRMVPTRANGQPAFGVYVHDPHSDLFHASGLLVVTLAGDRISAMTRFDNSVLDGFGLPRTLPD